MIMATLLPEWPGKGRLSPGDIVTTGGTGFGIMGMLGRC